MNKNKRPVIIIGMHRSGTGLLTKLLSESGVFLGKNIEQNGESVVFLKINQNILKMAKSSWSDPYKFDKNLIVSGEIISNYVGKKMSGFFSEDRYWGDTDIDNIFYWGWKDPRTTITLNIWKNIFPDSKVIHIYRNPVDVAASLMNREKKFTKNGKLKWHYSVLKNYFKFGVIARRDPDLLDIYRGIELWEFYVKRAFSFEDNIIHIKYEDLLEDPVDILSKILDFLSIEENRAHMELITNSIDKNRKYAFLSEKNLIDVYKRIKENEFIKVLGYNKIL